MAHAVLEVFCALAILAPDTRLSHALDHWAATLLARASDARAQAAAAGSPKLGGGWSSRPSGWKIHPSVARRT
eukprot:8405981-Pyramimonas_sp.AAC.1